MLKEIRIKRGLTQQELADKVGVTRQTISMIETGKNNPSGKLAMAIAKVLNIKDWRKIFNK